MAYKAKRMEDGRYAIRLDLYRGEKLVEAMILNQSVIKVGTLSSSGLKLHWGKKVSRMHAVIEVNAPGDISVIDLGSRDGTFLNDAKINKAQVNIGDELRFGDVRVVVAPLDRESMKDLQKRAVGISEEALETPASRSPDRMNFTECMDWASDNSVLVHFNKEGVVAGIEGGKKVRGTTFRGAINILRDYSSD